MLNKSCCEKKEEIFVSTQRICIDVWYKIPLILMTSQNAIFTCNLLLSWCDIKQCLMLSYIHIVSFSKWYWIKVLKTRQNRCVNIHILLEKDQVCEGGCLAPYKTMTVVFLWSRFKKNARLCSFIDFRLDISYQLLCHDIAQIEMNS